MPGLPRYERDQNLTKDRFADSSPDWSPDARRCVFLSNRDGVMNVYSMKLDGSDVQQLTRGTTPCSSPRWSPAGAQIVYVQAVNGIDQLFRMDADGKNHKQLTKSRFASRQPAWSPDGKLSFSRYGPAIYTTMLIDVDGRNERDLTDTGGSLDAAWSPDGKHFAFTSIRGGVGAFRVDVIDADGKNVKQLSENNNHIGYVYPQWSPDGRTIAYTEMVEGILQVATVDVVGKNRKILTTKETHALH